jgi:hypothetical protein
VYIPRVRTVCRNVPATPDPPKAHTAHSTSRMNWIELELVATVELDSLLDPLDADCGRGSMLGLAAGRPRQACTEPHQDPSNDTRDQRDIPQERPSACRRTDTQTRSISIRTVVGCRAQGPEGLWGSPNRVRNNHGQTHASQLVANHRHPPRPRPCRCVWPPAAPLIARAALPQHRLGASGARHPATHPRHRFHVVTV